MGITAVIEMFYRNLIVSMSTTLLNEREGREGGRKEGWMEGRKRNVHSLKDTVQINGLNRRCVSDESTLKDEIKPIFR